MFGLLIGICGRGGFFVFLGFFRWEEELPGGGESINGGIMVPEKKARQGGAGIVNLSPERIEKEKRISKR